MAPKTLVYYIDSHGFGHTTRSLGLAQVLAPHFDILFRTNSPAWLLAEGGISPDRIVASPIDLHPVHSTGFQIDVGATLERIRRFLSNADRLLIEEAYWLADTGADVVVSDITPLAIAAASRAGIPAFAISNFTWDWIFEPMAETKADLEGIRTLRRMMGQASLAFRLPFCPPDCFSCPSVATPLLARPLLRSRDQTRAYYGFGEEAKVVLLTFGGTRDQELDWTRLEGMDRFRFYQVAQGNGVPSGQGPQTHPDRSIRNLFHLEDPDLYHPDLVHAVDALVTKPGYGTLSEAMATAKPMILAPRPDFREFGPMVEALKPYPQVDILEAEDFRTLNWGAALEKVLAVKPKPWEGGTDGAGFIVKRMLEVLNQVP